MPKPCRKSCAAESFDFKLMFDVAIVGGAGKVNSFTVAGFDFLYTNKLLL